ncbi:GMP reductase [bacterium]|nr:GMP reductase [bacterium]
MKRTNAYRYEDVTLVPSYSECQSRSDLSTSIKLGKKVFKLPVVLANMRAVIDIELAEELSKKNYFYIMHRFDVDTIKFVHNANVNDWKCISISVGVKEEDYELILQLASLKLKVDYITVDIAHGHSKRMGDMLIHIKRCLPDTFVIAGNVATVDAVMDLNDWGADCVNVGIGQGHVCTTKDKTGFTAPMFTCVQECVGMHDIPIIADGGIRCTGDIAKALVAGAEMVMMGSQFSACLDSPAETVNRDGAVYKRYFGSASVYNKRTKRHIEGIMKEIPCNQMTVSEKLLEITDDLKSAISYAGGNDLGAFNYVEYNILK